MGPVHPSGVFSREKKIPPYRRSNIEAKILDKNNSAKPIQESFTELFLSNILKYSKNDTE